ncbi:MAG: MFS transporter [Anaerolineae bacterium]|nr:MFS transporter [Anaerolineae bacterium]
MRGRKVDYTAVLIAYFSFIVLGMPGALLGIVWSPHIRDSFALELDAVATLYITLNVGYFVASFISGRLFSRLNIGLLLAGGCILAALAFAGYAIAPAWFVIVVLGFVAGFGGGILDGGMNIYFAAHFDSRLMNWLHACFGIGSTIAPFIITIVLANEGSWRAGYWMIAGLYVLVAALFYITRARWLPLNIHHEQATAAPHASVRATLRLPIVWVGIGIFALFAGLEASTGQWSKSIFFESRGVAEAVASNWVAFYWLSFTIGRIVFGFIVTRIEAGRLIRICMAGALAGMALLVWNPFPESGVVALALFGFMFGPIFAILVTATQERMGSLHAANAIGFQVAAATVGVGLLPGVLGVAGVNFGLESITVALLALVIVMAVLYELWRRMPVRSSAAYQSVMQFDPPK